MADIKQAAKWMQEGKRVARKGHTYSIYVRDDRLDAIIFHERNGGEVDAAIFFSGDLLADDWEIAE